jgi:hypothetical protein
MVVDVRERVRWAREDAIWQATAMRALRTKLPKLIKTDAEKHILFLEPQHMNLCPESMLDEIENRKARFRILRSSTRSGSWKPCFTIPIRISASSTTKMER